MKIAIVIMLSMFVCGCVTMRPFTATEAATDALIIADWAQTLEIADNQNRWVERNPLLGSHPSKERVSWSIGGALLANTVIHRVLLDKWLGRYQLCLIVAEGTAVAENYQLGVRAGF